MTKKFTIKEAWLLNENGDKTLKLNLLDADAIPSLVKEEDIRGGYGNIKEDKIK